MGLEQVNTRAPGFYPVEPMRQEPYIRLHSMPVGLSNLGSTCWFNVVVQLLYHIPIFRNAIMEWQDPFDICPAQLKAFIENLHLLFVTMQFSEDRQVDPTCALSTIGTLLGCGKGQQDASEYLALLVNRLRDAGLHIVQQLFIGSLVENHGIEEFLQHTIHVQCDTDLRKAINSSLMHTSAISRDVITKDNVHNRKYFTKLPPILLFDLNRLTLDKGAFIKTNYQLAFPSFLNLNHLLMEKETKGHLLKPYQLLAAIVHHGQSGAGHFSIDLWDQQQQSWFHIDDNHSNVITWEEVIEDGYGGLEKECSAYTLVYVDAAETKSILGTTDEYDLSLGDVLNYLRDPMDVKTSNSSFGLGFTIEAALGIPHDRPENESKLFTALEYERQRLLLLWQQSQQKNCPLDESRLQHFVVYLIANNVDFEPFIYWALLIHFASFNLLLKEETSNICTAARHALAYLEKSTTSDEKYVFLQWNWCYYEFHLMARHLLCALEHLSNGNFSAAVPAAVTVLYLQDDLMKRPVKGPSTSFNSDMIHSVIDKSIMSLSDELLKADFETIAEEARMILFEAMSVWIHFSDADNQETVRSVCQWLISRWRDHVIAHKCEPSAAEVTLELDRVQQILIFPPSEKRRTNFKLHIRSPSKPDGPLLAYHWSRTWHSFNENYFASLNSSPPVVPHFGKSYVPSPEHIPSPAILACK